jgi:surface carbohydrate biosynthesis protein
MNLNKLKIVLMQVTSINFWKKPNNAKYLIVDESGSKDLFNSNIITEQDSFVLGLRNYEWLNINLLFWLIKEGKYSLLLKERFLLVVLFYVDNVEPSFVITWMDYIVPFYKLKSYFPKPKYISIQVGRRSNEPGEFFDRLESMIDEKLSCDYIFSFGEAHAREYEKYINCKAIPSGSIRNNNIPIVHKKNETKDKRKLLFISQYRKPKNDGIFTTYKEVVTWNQVYKAEILLLPMLVEYCNKNSIELHIAASIANTMELEKLFYDNLIGSENYKYIEKQSDVSNYEVVDNFNFITGINSTLLTEALGRGKKVAFFDCRCNYTGIPFNVFGWPLKLELQGKFWTNDIENGDVEKILDYITGVSKDNWKEDVDLILSSLINYDENNSLLRKVLS